MYRTIFLAVGLSLFMCAVAQADPVDCKERQLTPDEVRFYQSIENVVKGAFPPPQGWKATVREDIPHRKTVCVGFKNQPMSMGWSLTLQKITQREKEEAATKGDVASLKKAMQEAAQKGDIDTIMRLQQDYQKILAAQTPKMQKDMSSLMKNPNRSASKPPQIEITVVINGSGETIAKKYEIPMAGVVKAFETSYKKKGKEIVTRKLYIGAWRIVDFQNNWKILRRDTPHAKPKNAFLWITSERQQLESYIKTINLAPIKTLVQ